MQKMFFLIVPFLLLTSCKEKPKETDRSTTGAVLAPPKNRPPNIIVIFTDDQGYQDVGVFGSKIKTPNLDRMAEEGLKLTSFYAAQPVCTASRAALLTGCYPNRIGIHGALFPNSPTGLNPSEITIAEMLKKENYKTALFGKWHLGDHPSFMPNNQGFDEFFGIPYSNDMWPYHPEQEKFNFGPLPLYENNTAIDTLVDQSHLTTAITKRSVDFISKNKEHPFFLYVAHPQPHVPLFVSEKFKDKSGEGLYGDVIMELDWSVGQILGALKNNGIDDDTLVIFTSDNGPWLSYGDHAGKALPFREGKRTVFEGGVREPTIVRFPKKIPSGRTLNAPMMNIDVLPTIAEITRAKLPNAKIDGKSVWELWTGDSEQNAPKAYFFYYNTNELQAVRYGKWKLYFPHEYASLNGREGGKNGLSVAYDQNTVTEIELYDLSMDKGERTNVAKKNVNVVQEVTVLADEMRKSLGDGIQGVQGEENRPAGTIE